MNIRQYALGLQTGREMEKIRYSGFETISRKDGWTYKNLLHFKTGYHYHSAFINLSSKLTKGKLAVINFENQCSEVPLIRKNGKVSDFNSSICTLCCNFLVISSGKFFFA